MKGSPHMPDPSIEETTTEDVQATVATAAERTVDKLADAADAVGTVITESIPAAMVGAMDRIAATQSRTIQLLEAQENLFTENLNALSRAQANTDISAQRAAEAAGTIAEELEPPEQTAPDAGEKPERLKELPSTQASGAERKEKWWFGKAARRHGKNG